jgi:hypothetical protein
LTFKLSLQLKVNDLKRAYYSAKEKEKLFR